MRYKQKYTKIGKYKIQLDKSTKNTKVKCECNIKRKVAGRRMAATNIYKRYKYTRYKYKQTNPNTKKQDIPPPSI